MDSQYWSEIIQLIFLHYLLSYGLQCQFHTFSSLLNPSILPVLISLKAGVFAFYFTVKTEDGGKLTHLPTISYASLPVFTPICSAYLPAASNELLLLLRPLPPSSANLCYFSYLCSLLFSPWLVLICLQSKRNALMAPSFIY